MIIHEQALQPRMRKARFDCLVKSGVKGHNGVHIVG